LKRAAATLGRADVGAFASMGATVPGDFGVLKAADPRRFCGPLGWPGAALPPEVIVVDDAAAILAVPALARSARGTEDVVG
jgi:hypothetical protein